MPKKLRALYQPKPGYKFVQTDQAGAEALIVAYLCKPGNYRQLFLNGINPHVFTAAHIFKDRWKEHIPVASLAKVLSTPIPEIPALPEWKSVTKIIKSSDDWEPKMRYYFMGKKVGHAGNYDMRGPTFALDTLKESEGAIVLDIEEANRLLEDRRRLFPEIPMWHYSIQELWSHYKGQPITLRNLFGFPRQFNDTPSDKTFKEAYAFIPQSTVGTITNIAYTLMQTYIELCDMISKNGRMEHKLSIDHPVIQAIELFGWQKKQWDMLNNCHDSYLTQAPDDEAELCGRVQKFFIEQELTAPRGEKFRMKSETQWGFNWAPYKADKNPQGLQVLALN